MGVAVLMLARGPSTTARRPERRSMSRSSALSATVSPGGTTRPLPPTWSISISADQPPRSLQPTFMEPITTRPACAAPSMTA